MQSSAARLARRVGATVVLLTGLALALPVTSSATDPPLLKTGDKGYWVRVLQQDLTISGYPTQPTGYFGDRTRSQLNKFKIAHGLVADGEAYPRTWQALRDNVHRAETAPVHPAHINSKGYAVAPDGAPKVVKAVIAAANKIAFKPYLYGGGHASWNSSGYDCSGSVSFALHGAGLLWYPEDSSELESYGHSGLGRWITVYANAGHAYMRVAGLWYDTSDQQWGSYRHGDRWSTKRVSSASGYIIRHPNAF